MQHIAIVKKSWGLIPKILNGEKTIESRWYVRRRTLRRAISNGDPQYRCKILNLSSSW